MRRGAHTISRVLTSAAPGALICLLSACSDGPVKSVHLSLVAAPRLNPDETGLPNPVQLRVFMLKTSDAFTNTDYFQLEDKEKAVLGGDLLAQTNDIVRPGQTKTMDLPVPPGAKFIGVSAAYRNIDQATWRVATPVQRKVTIDAGPDALAVAAPAK